jgi:GTP diphosphokinase / guanosine-3',5'-bis(diphosphate) 3'-diphosphatase
MAVVERALPWRRSASPDVPIELVPLLDVYKAKHPKASTRQIIEAYHLAADAHKNQFRRSGEAYINHPLAVARVVAEIGLDEPTVIAALIHDVVEDTAVTLGDVEKQFGAVVAMLVDGCTKVDRLHFDSKEEQQAATMRKMLVAMARDARVLIIKLSDRLHNMRTLAAMRAENQARTAAETLDIYAPLAHRLGMQGMKTQLEDLAFASLYPKRYAEIDHMVALRTPERDLYLARVIADVRGRLAELKISAEVTGRGKHLWSIYEKMQLKGRGFDEIFDLVGVRILVNDVKDCYAAVGCMHGTYSPVVGRFKDYIAMPKFNLYQSLHTTVIGPGGKTLDVQIRTREMHSRAEHGVAAHWAYKSNGKGGGDDLAWLARLTDWQDEAGDPNRFLAELKTDLQQDEVFVFTPKGKVIALPVGSTPVDFAYAVHTDVGHNTIGARVNGRLVPLGHELQSGVTCEIVTRKTEGGGPNRDWLQFLVSPRARSKVRHWFSRERRGDSADAGRDELADALRREGLPVQRLLTGDEIGTEAIAMGYADAASLLVAIGEHHVTAKSVAQRLARVLRAGTTDELLPTTVSPTRKTRRGQSEVGVHVEGLDDVMVRLSRCCTPVPGDDIMGFITRGRGVSVHRSDCANAVDLQRAQGTRMIDVEWDESRSRSGFVASIEVKAYNRIGLLRDITGTLADHRIGIVNASTATGNDQVATMRFEIDLTDPGHLTSVLRNLRAIDGVFDSYRAVPGGGSKT